MGYTKLFSTIVTSSIWTADDTTRIVWITMLAISDKNGEIHAAIPGLARLAGVSLEACEKAVTTFLSPDPYSRTKEDEGRRLETIDGGWLLINHAKYRRMASDEERKEQSAIRQQRFRDRHAKNNATVTPPSHHNNGNGEKVTVESRQISHADSEAKADSNTKAVPEVQKPAKSEGKGTQLELEAYAVEIGLPASDGTAMFDHWTANGWKNGSTASKCWRAGMRKWKGQGWMPSQKVIHNGKPRNQAYQGGESATAGKTADQVGNLFGEQHDEP